MIAESLLRILEKQRARALQLGTFCVGLLPKGPARFKPGDPLPVHESVIRHLLAEARECRVYGVSARSPLFAIVSRLGDRSGRVWNLNVRCELINGAELLWNASCQHAGIVVTSQLSVAETAKILASFAAPQVWASRYQLAQGTSRAAVSFCFEAVRPGDLCAFLFSGSNGIEWMDVFANAPRLAELWDRMIEEKKQTGLTRPCS
jgi:hypothetical protein